MIDGQDVWLPAYRVYFGKDWIGEQSVEVVLDSLPADDPARESVELPFLAPPATFMGHLSDTRNQDRSAEAAENDVLDDEVGIDEDTTDVLDTSERDRWFRFLSWIGVNPFLRPVHFNDVEEDRTGWLTTKDLAKPQGRAFRHLGETWDAFRIELVRNLERRTGFSDTVPYLYELHDLEGIVPLLDAARRDASNSVAQSLFNHFVRHWSSLATFSDAKVALVEKGKSPSSRTRPPRATSQELTEAGDDLWLFRLRRSDFVPTTHGPRRSVATWSRSAEVERRFGRRDRPAGAFLPILDVGDDLSANALRVFSQRLGIRNDLSPSSFSLDDADLVCRRLELLYHDSETIDVNQMRTVIKPIYREVLELLSGHSHGTSDRPLSETPLLAQSASGLEFLPARDVLYARTPGTLERSGIAHTLPTFVLDAESGATAPLANIFGVRVLEEALEWKPEPGEGALDPEQLVIFRQELRQLVPPLLARLRVERTERRDRRILEEFAERAEPVDSLRLTCSLEGQVLQQPTDRSFFVRAPTRDRPLQAFVVWDGPAWPPLPEVAETLAMALADAVGVNMVETFLLFVEGGPAHRLRLLDLAGGSGHMREIEDEMRQPEEVVEGTDISELEPTAAPETGDEEEEAAPFPTSVSVPAAAPIPLLQFEDITIDGIPIMVVGDPQSGALGVDSGTQGSPGSGHSASPRPRAAAGMDLGALDRLGMSIAMTYELRRLQRQGATHAEVIRIDEGVMGSNLVVDVHSPASIGAAERSSEVVRRVMAEFESVGISRVHPGFDILTIAAGEPDRLIELKSSGVDARVQAMSWNEWKSARSNDARSRFWLYLVGNLRADLAGASPFVRAIKDPFGALAAIELEEHSVRRAVQLRVREFTVAESLVLTVSPARLNPDR